MRTGKLMCVITKLQDACSQVRVVPFESFYPSLIHQWEREAHERVELKNYIIIPKFMESQKEKA